MCQEAAVTGLEMVKSTRTFSRYGCSVSWHHSAQGTMASPHLSRTSSAWRDEGPGSERAFEVQRQCAPRHHAPSGCPATGQP